MSLVQDLRLLIQHLDDAAQRVAGVRQTASTAGPQLADALQGSQRTEPGEIQARIAKAEQDTHRAVNVLREAVECARRYSAAL